MRKIKVLCYHDSPTIETGFAQVAKQILKKLYATEEFEFTICAINHFDTFYDQTKYPYKIHTGAVQGDPLSKQLFIRMLQAEKFDILFTFNDFGLINQFADAIKELRALKKFVWVTYSPVDIENPNTLRLQSFLEADIPVVYTQFGYDLCVKLYPELEGKLKIMYHGTDVDTFHRVKETKRKEYRSTHFLSDENTFLVGNINRNQWRKDLSRSMLAFKEFKYNIANVEDRYKIKYYIHAKIDDIGGSLAEQAKAIGLLPKEDIMFSEIRDEGKGIPRSRMNRVYNSLDLLISTTVGEGWGLSCTEAFAAKVPVIMPYNTSFPEIVGKNNERGILTRSGGSPTEYVCFYREQNWLRPIVNVEEMAQNMNLVFEDWKKDHNYTNTKTGERLENAHKWATDHQWDSINEEWIAIFKKAFKKLKRK